MHNLRAALAWAATADAVGELAQALVGNSVRVWNNTHLLTEGMDRCLALRHCLGDELRAVWGLALCAALQGRVQDAARIIGYRDAVMARAGVGNQYYAPGVDDSLARSLRTGLEADELARLCAEGAAMREEDVVRLMLGDPS